MRKLISILVFLMIIVTSIFGQTYSNEWAVSSYPDWVIVSLDNDRAETFRIGKIKYIPAKVRELINADREAHPRKKVYYAWRQLDAQTVQLYIYEVDKNLYSLILVFNY